MLIVAPFPDSTILEFQPLPMYWEPALCQPLILLPQKPYKKEPGPQSLNQPVQLHCTLATVSLVTVVTTFPVVLTKHWQKLLTREKRLF